MVSWGNFFEHASQNKEARMKKRAMKGFVCCLALVGTVSSFAATWTGGGSDSYWSTGGNWGGTAPTPGVTTALVFDGLTRTVNTNDFPAGSEFLSIAFGADADDFTLNGAQIKLGNGGGPSTVIDIRASTSTDPVLVINNAIDMNEAILTTIQNYTDTIVFNGLITNGLSYVATHVYNFQGGIVELNNPGNSFNRGIGMIGGCTLTTDDLKDSFVNSKIGAGSAIKLGNAGSGGTFVYNGAAASTDRQLIIGGGTGSIAYTAGGTLNNNGSGAIVFDNAAFNMTFDNTWAERTLTLGGSYDGSAGANVVGGSIVDNDTSTTGLVHIVVSDSVWQFEGTNTYTGDTTVDGALTLADDARLTFVIGANGVNNAVDGTGTVVFNGDFIFDLTGAGTNENDAWLIVDKSGLSATFGSSFSVVGFSDAGDGLWTKDGYQFDEHTGVLSLIVPGTTIYQDDFSGTAGPSTTTVPEISPTGFEHNLFLTGLDGSGRLESTNVANSASGYRVKLGAAPLTDNPSIDAIRLTVRMRTPTNDWIMIGFQEDNLNALLDSNRNTGPMMQVNPSSVVLRSGWPQAENSYSPSFTGFFSPGDEITLVMTYHVDTQTMDLSANALTVTNGFVVEHQYPSGTNSDPVVYWLNSQIRYQQTAANGGGYIDSWKVEILPEVAGFGYEGWAADWGVYIGTETNDYDGDGLNNLSEYGLGGDPTDDTDQGVAPVCGVSNVGGTETFSYVHPQLSASDSGLTYSLELTTDLVSGTWTNAGYSVQGTNVTGGTLDYVTNLTDMVDSRKFIRLIIE
jgi:hypothetical protein